MLISDMPVTPEEWESGAAYTPLAKGILSFLRENFPMGYSANEVWNMLPEIGREHGFDGDSMPPYAVEEALAGLADTHIETKELKNETATERYYRAIN